VEGKSKEGGSLRRSWEAQGMLAPHCLSIGPLTPVPTPHPQIPLQPCAPQVVLRTDKAKEATKEVLATHCISSDRSPDLEAGAGAKAAKAAAKAAAAAAAAEANGGPPEAAAEANGGSKAGGGRRKGRG
jgi:hypothetical protein